MVTKVFENVKGYITYEDGLFFAYQVRRGGVDFLASFDEEHLNPESFLRRVGSTIFKADDDFGVDYDKAEMLSAIEACRSMIATPLTAPSDLDLYVLDLGEKNTEDQPVLRRAYVEALPDGTYDLTFQYHDNDVVRALKSTKPGNWHNLSKQDYEIALTASGYEYKGKIEKGEIL
ncbi:hypothetical protein [Spirosoma sp. 209]|uniref:hypothetical protein n=1 Tax=Spirosoma sp. 209 TaxID=1955701 RepID=UPI001116E249|nr:hypothetical protein [Spirosoma sp. 209]